LYRIGLKNGSLIALWATKLSEQDIWGIIGVPQIEKYEAFSEGIPCSGGGDNTTLKDHSFPIQSQYLNVNISV
jgi:hypothetical protein